MGHNINTELTWLTQREKHSRKKEQYVQKLGGSRMNSKDWKVPRVTTVDGKGVVYWETWSRALRVCLLGMERIMETSFSILEAFQVDWSVFIHFVVFQAYHPVSELFKMHSNWVSGIFMSPKLSKVKSFLLNSGSMVPGLPSSLLQRESIPQVPWLMAYLLMGVMAQIRYQTDWYEIGTMLHVVKKKCNGSWEALFKK